MVKEIDKFQDPPKLAIKFANAVFVLGILFSILLVIYAMYKIYNPPESVTNTFYLICVLFGIISSTLFGLGLRLGRNLKVNLSLVILSLGISVYVFEVYLELTQLQKLETRTKTKVLEDLRKVGFKAYYNFFPSVLLVDAKDGLELSTNNSKIEKNLTEHSLYPLGGVSNITTILNNESGYYPIIETDEHGFNNPKGLYKKNEVDIMLTGDSFTEGLSVHSDENISAVLRESGFKVINIGKAGNGPLLELAALNEYAKPLQPKIVLWLYYINDLHILNSEMSSSLLREYFKNDSFSQNLILRQDEIDMVLKNYFKKKYITNPRALKIDKEDDPKEKLNERRKKIEKITRKNFRYLIENIRVIEIFQLYNLRSKIKLIPELVLSQLPYPYPPVGESELEVFKKIIKKSKNIVTNWGGKLYFVYLPSQWMVESGKEDSNYKDILNIVNQSYIPIINTYNKVFANHHNPLSLFPFIRGIHHNAEGYRLSGTHYNAKGYRLIAEAISKRLEDDGIIPSELDN